MNKNRSDFFFKWNKWLGGGELSRNMTEKEREREIARQKKPPDRGGKKGWRGRAERENKVIYLSVSKFFFAGKKSSSPRLAMHNFSPTHRHKVAPRTQRRSTWARRWMGRRHDNQLMTSRLQVTACRHRRNGPRQAGRQAGSEGRHFWGSGRRELFWGLYSSSLHTAGSLSRLRRTWSKVELAAPARAHTTLARAVRVHANRSEDSVAYLLAREVAGNLRPLRIHMTLALQPAPYQI